ncbi:MAG TPA: type II toxin-antitoxin system Phd/YefM family antitoxin [Vicinamibacterales bacterium]
MMYICVVSKRYSIADARTSLAAIVDQAEAGRKVELTRRGRAVAVVISLREFERLRGGRRPFAKAYGAFLEKYRPSEIGPGADFPPPREKDPGRKVSL